MSVPCCNNCGCDCDGRHAARWKALAKEYFRVKGPLYEHKCCDCIEAWGPLKAQRDALRAEVTEANKLLDQTANECLAYERENDTLRALVGELVQWAELERVDIADADHFEDCLVRARAALGDREA